MRRIEAFAHFTNLLDMVVFGRLDIAIAYIHNF
jgi:hypothetical protein